MNQRTILFDLDGTLLPMDQDAFTRGYFKLLAKKLAPHGYDPAALVDHIWAGIAAMVKNDGSRPNEAAFWAAFAGIYGQERVQKDMPLFDAFYRVEFQQAKDLCGQNPKAKEAVEACKAAGYQVALATNPIFPTYATESRIRWAGLEPEDFALYTTYENIGYSKPNPAYYREVAARLGVLPEACLMVGNDVDEDMIAARQAGMEGFLLTDCLINREGREIASYPQGSFADFLNFLKDRQGRGLAGNAR